MTRLVKFFLFGGPLALLILTAIAAYSYSRIRHLHLPIPDALALFTVILPIITGISIQGVYGLIQKSSETEQNQLTLPLVVVLGFQLIYETIVGTLALTYIVPPSSLHCGLEDIWGKLFNAKDERAIRRIQDSFNCCGFSTVKDRAFPFGGQHPSPCAEIFDRSQSCFGPLRKSEQTHAGLLFLVSILVFMITSISVIFLLTNSSWTNSQWVRPFKRLAEHSSSDEEDNRAAMRRLIESSAAGEPYRDNPEEATPVTADANGSGSQDPGPRVQPSALAEGHNEWRE